MSHSRATYPRISATFTPKNFSDTNSEYTTNWYVVVVVVAVVVVVYFHVSTGIIAWTTLAPLLQGLKHATHDTSGTGSDEINFYSQIHVSMLSAVHQYKSNPTHSATKGEPHLYRSNSSIWNHATIKFEIWDKDTKDIYYFWNYISAKHATFSATNHFQSIL